MNQDGECPEDDCDYKAPRYQSENPANIFDSEWEKTTEITFEVTAYEYCLQSPADSYTPSITVKVSLPKIGTKFTPVPMFRLADGGTTEHLEKVYMGSRTDIVAIYSKGTYLRRSITSDHGSFDKGDPWEEEHYIEKVELLWDNEWPGTTDPMYDIELAGVELDD